MSLETLWLHGDEIKSPDFGHAESGGGGPLIGPGKHGLGLRRDISWREEERRGDEHPR